MQRKFQTITLTVFVAGATGAFGVVLYSVADRQLRLVLGLFLFALVLLAGARLGVVEQAVDFGDSAP